MWATVVIFKKITKVNNRPIRENSPNERLFILDSFLKITKLAYMFWLLFPNLRLWINFWGNRVGIHFGRFWTNSSGHTGAKLCITTFNNNLSGKNGSASFFGWNSLVSKKVIAPNFQLEAIIWEFLKLAKPVETSSKRVFPTEMRALK
jgi:hypothetical protein